MPTYALKCRGCGTCFEQFARFEEKAAVPCPKCGQAGCDIDCSNLHIGANVRTPSHAPQSGLSMRFGFHPDEVQEARRELPNWSITDDGDVVVDSGKHNARMMRDLETMQARTSVEAARAGLSGGLDSTSPPVTVPKATKEARKRARVEKFRELQKRKLQGRSR